MRVLVCDEDRIGREAARAQLSDHELTIVGSYEEAEAMLQPWTDHRAINQVIAEFKRRDPDPADSSEDTDEWRAQHSDWIERYRRVREEALEAHTHQPKFDAVLSVETEERSGLLIALLATAKAQICGAAVLGISWASTFSDPIAMECSYVHLCDDYFVQFHPKNLVDPVRGTREDQAGTVRARHWVPALERIIEANS